MLIDSKQFDTKEEMIKYIIETKTFKGYTCPSTLAHNLPFVFSTETELMNHMITHAVYELQSSSDLTVTQDKNNIDLEPLEYLKTVSTEFIKPINSEAQTNAIQLRSTSLNEPVTKEMFDVKPLIITKDLPEEYHYVKNTAKTPFICAICGRDEHKACRAKTCECNHIDHFDEETKAMITASIDSDNMETLMSIKEYLNEENITGIYHVCIDENCEENIKGEILALLCDKH